MKEVWICDPNYHKIQWAFALIFSKNYQCFEKLYQTLERVFHQNVIQILWSWLKKTQLPLIFFNPLLSVWISGETFFLVFDILLQKLHPNFHLLQIYYAFITLFCVFFSFDWKFTPAIYKTKQNLSRVRACQSLASLWIFV